LGEIEVLNEILFNYHNFDRKKFNPIDYFKRQTLETKGIRNKNLQSNHQIRHSTKKIFFENLNSQPFFSEAFRFELPRKSTK
jgi:hypothetical protein